MEPEQNYNKDLWGLLIAPGGVGGLGLRPSFFVLPFSKKPRIMQKHYKKP